MLETSAMNAHKLQEGVSEVGAPHPAMIKKELANDGHLARRSRTHYIHVPMNHVLTEGYTDPMGLMMTGILIGLPGVIGMGTMAKTLPTMFGYIAAARTADFELGEGVERGRWQWRRTWALAVAAPPLEPLHP